MASTKVPTLIYYRSHTRTVPDWDASVATALCLRAYGQHIPCVPVPAGASIPKQSTTKRHTVFFIGCGPTVDFVLEQAWLDAFQVFENSLDNWDTHLSYMKTHDVKVDTQHALSMLVWRYMMNTTPAPLLVNTLELRHERRFAPNADVLGALMLMVPRGLHYLADYLSDQRPSGAIALLGHVQFGAPLRAQALQTVLSTVRRMVVDDETCLVCVCHDVELWPELEQHFYNQTVLVIHAIDQSDESEDLVLRAVKWSPNRSPSTGRGHVMRSTMCLAVAGPDQLRTVCTYHVV